METTNSSTIARCNAAQCVLDRLADKSAARKLGTGELHGRWHRRAIYTDLFGERTFDDNSAWLRVNTSYALTTHSSFADFPAIYGDLFEQQTFGARANH